MRIARYEDIFTLLRKLLAKPSCEHPSTMMFADYCRGTPLLPTMPFPDRNHSEWSCFVACLSAGWGAPRRLWEDCGRHC
jgi:hypothetical protein